MMRAMKVFAAGLAILAPGLAHAGANLVTNGNFATTTTTASNGNFELTAAGTYGTVAGWTTANSTTSTNPYNVLFTTAATGNASDANQTETTTTSYSPSASAANAYGQYSSSGLEYLASGYNETSPNGGNFMALDGDTTVNGYLEQTITGLVTGGTYELDFYWAVAQMASRSGAVSDSLTAALGNSSQSTATVNIASGGFSGWMTSKMLFTATGTSELLSFLSTGAPAGYPPLALLDGVSLSQVPEPSALGLLAIGLGGAVFLRRRLKGRAA